MSEPRITKRSLRDRRTGRTDWERIREQSDDDIAANAAGDPDAAPPLDEEWMRTNGMKSSRS